MAKTTAPLLSFSAAGQIGRVQVYSKWKGRGYARQYVIPANPQTEAQNLTRDVFRWLSDAWKLAPSEFQTPWTAYATGKVLTNRNALNKFNVSPLREAEDLSTFVFSPGALGGLPPDAISVTPGSGSLTVAITPPAVLPTGWSINMAVAACLPDQDPHDPFTGPMVAGTDDSTPYEVSLEGLDTVLQRVGAWLVWNRPDGTLAYSTAVTDTGTPN